MTKKEAKQHGRANGEAAIAYCEVSNLDQIEAGCECDDHKVCAECLSQAAYASEMNARDFSPFEFLAAKMNEDEERSDDLWAAYDEGVGIGIRKGIPARLKLQERATQ